MKASELLDGVADKLIADLRDPAARTGLILGFATSAACARMGLRFLPSLALTTAAIMGGKRLYTVIDDVHKAAIATQKLAVETTLGQMRERLAGGNAEPRQD